MTASTWLRLRRRAGPIFSIAVATSGSFTRSMIVLGFADLRGNKQYISTANLKHDGRVALFFMDYPTQSRLKILGNEYDPTRAMPKPGN